MTPPHAHDSTSRFSDRVENYVRYRPGYPRELLDSLVESTGLGPGKTVADLGSGTGISAALLLESGCEVFAVEPNAAMRAAAEERLGGEPRFRSVDGTAEATGLPDASVDLVTAAQAFHWFDRERTRAEMRRILRGDGHPAQLALFWNSRKTDTTPFLRDYEALLRRFGTDYAEIDHTRIGSESLAPFFGGPFERRVFPNRQVFGFDGLRGRLLSSSYVPAPGHPDHDEMLTELRRIFDRHEEDGRVTFEYDTELYLGRLA